MDYLLSVPRNVLRKLLREMDTDSGFSEEAARLSLLLDVENGSVKSQRAYGRIWGWNRNTVRCRWEEIWKDVAEWVCSFGRQLSHPLVDRLPDKWKAWLMGEYGQEKPPSNAKPKTTHQPPSDHPLTTQKSPPERRETGSTTHQPPNDHPPTTHHTNNPNPIPNPFTSNGGVVSSNVSSGSNGKQCSNKTSSSGTDHDLSFLPQRDRENHLADIQRNLTQLEAENARNGKGPRGAGLDRLKRLTLGGSSMLNPQQARHLTGFLKEHGWTKTVAACTIAANKEIPLNSLGKIAEQWKKRSTEKPKNIFAGMRDFTAEQLEINKRRGANYA